jgi:hypothetical protein
MNQKLTKEQETMMDIDNAFRLCQSSITIMDNAIKSIQNVAQKLQQIVAERDATIKELNEKLATKNEEDKKVASALKEKK